MNINNGEFPVKLVAEKIRLSAKVQANTSARIHAELNRKIDTLSAIVIALAEIIELAGIAGMNAIKSTIASFEKSGNNLGASTSYNDALVKFGFDLNKIDVDKKLMATKTAVNNRKLRKTDDDLF